MTLTNPDQVARMRRAHREGDLNEQERLLVVRDGDSPEQLEHVADWLLEELPFMLRETAVGPSHHDRRQPCADRP